MASRGRPTKYTDELADRICQLFATGPATVRGVCAEVGIATEVFFIWLNKYEYFSKQYARAKEAQAQLLADEIVEVARTPMLGQVVTDKPQGVETRTGDMVEHRKLLVDALKWKASKLAPKLYGDRTVLAGDPEAPLNPVVIVKDTMSAEELAKLKGK